MAPSLLETFPNRVDQPVWNRHRKVRERLEGQAARGWCIERERYSQSSGGRSRQEQSGSGSAVLLWCMLSACSDGSSNSDDSSAAPAGIAAGQSMAAPDPVKGVSRTVVLDGLQQPWDITLLPGRDHAIHRAYTRSQPAAHRRNAEAALGSSRSARRRTKRSTWHRARQRFLYKPYDLFVVPRRRCMCDGHADSRHA